MKILHVTTVHPRRDNRIFIKEVGTLEQEWTGDIALCVADGLGNSGGVGGEVRTIDVGELPRGHLGRALSGQSRVWRLARSHPMAIIHFHDPELIPVALALKLIKHTVVYDAHEDLPRQILSKPWIPLYFRPLFAMAARGAEKIGALAFDALVAATPAIARRFPERKTVLIQNYPRLSEFQVMTQQPYGERGPAFGYVGGISSIRGGREMIKALGALDRPKVRLRLAGTFQPPAFRETLEALPDWKRVDFLGWADRPAVVEMLNNVRAGLVIFHPEPNHVDAQPNKLFEYMAAGLPVIASDFPLWRSIICKENCGLLVDPLNPAAIADAMQWILENPADAEAMGKRGRQAILSTYNWDREAEKLKALYRKLLAS